MSAKTPPRKRGIKSEDLRGLTEEFLDLIIELNSKAKHPTPAGVRLERIVRHHIHAEKDHRSQKKSRAGVTSTRTAKASNPHTVKRTN